MSSKQEDITLSIRKIKDNIKKKYKALKNQSAVYEREAEVRFKPLTDPIKQLSEKIVVKSEPVVIKQDREEQQQREDDPLENAVYDDGSERDWQEFINENNIGPRISPYLRLLEGDNSDTVYGITWDEDRWKLGTQTVQFRGDNFVIENEIYPATDGLLELVFMKQPVHYNKQELETYKNILERTGAHLKSDGKINSNIGYKYKRIIEKLFPRKSKKVGKGVRYTPYMKLIDSRVDYRHWDDPNELVDRLRLLIASKQAGNTGLDNEIISILEELKEAGIIKDFTNLSL